MKRKISRLLACLLLAAALLLPQTQAWAAGASFTGSSSLRAGDSVTVTFAVSGSNIVAVQGTLVYDTNSLEFISTSRLIGNPWSLEMNGSTLVIYDTSAGGSPVNNANLFSATFRVKSGVSAGTSVSAAVKNITVSDGASDSSLGDAYWIATIAAPLSGNANLASLSCSNGSLSPAFDSGTTQYSITVPYSVSSLSLSYSTQDSGASASVSGNSLSVGTNTVTITVKAANGSTKSYVIRATREQDPNYVPSSNANLASLSVSSGTLSPAFSPDVTDYVVYLPYEAEHAEVSGVAQDGKARSVTGSSADLEVGENPLTVTCKAEDGTEQTYTVRAIRMPAFEGVLPGIVFKTPADYTAVDEALAKIPADLSEYTEESAAAVQSAMDAVERELSADAQEQVDKMAEAIVTALAALKEKPEPVVEPEPEPEPEPGPTIWDKLLAAGTEKVSIPYVERLTGSLPVWIPAAVALGVLLLLFYLIGTLVGRAVGKRRTLRRLRKEQEAAQQTDDVVPVAAGVAGDETWELPVDAVVAATVAETVDGGETPETAPAVAADNAPEAPSADAPAPEGSIADAPAAAAPVPENPIPGEPEVQTRAASASTESSPASRTSRFAARSSLRSCSASPPSAHGWIWRD